MNVSQFSQATGLSPHTLRYYEKIGLLTNIQRNAIGHRVYSPKDIEWVQFILRLKETNMPLGTIVQYGVLRALGPSTLSERQVLLEEHRLVLHNHIEQQQQHLMMLDKKIAFYQNTPS